MVPDEGVDQEVRTYRMKLVTAPAPAAARAS